MKTVTLSALAAVVLAAPLAATAEDLYSGGAPAIPSFDNRWYVLPFATYTWADSDRGVDDSAGWGLAVGKPINQHLNLELRATYTNMAGERYDSPVVNSSYVGTGSFNVSDLAVDALWVFSRGRFQPFLLGGLGVISDDFSCDATRANKIGGCESASNKMSFMAEVGAGFMVPITEYASFRMDGRYRYDDNSGDIRDTSDFGDWMVTAGIYIPLGGRSKPPVTRTFELSADALFAFNKADLKPTGQTRIDGLARDLGSVNFNSVQVDGHTDPIGSAEYNQVLSERRADTVRSRLVDQGVPSDRINARGFGKTQLKVTEADCAGAKSREALIECYQPNRRVNVTVEGITEK
jgi:OmpA-OmpF porin, OOP family